jgi:predicted permease
MSLRRPRSPAMARPLLGSPQFAPREGDTMAKPDLIGTVIGDARYALRGLWRDKAFSLTALVLLALAIGANTATFTVLKRTILDPLPYPNADQLVRIYDYQKQRGMEFSVTTSNYLDWVVQSKSFDHLAAFGGRGMALVGQGEPELLIGLGVSANFLSTLGVLPALGRDFRPEENEQGRDRVLILSHSLWQRKFGGDAAVIGRSVRVNGESYEIVGVAAQGFVFPDRSYEAFTPLTLKGGDPQWNNRSAHYLKVVGRLRASQTIEAASAEMTQVAAGLEQQYPDTNKDLGVRLHPLKERVVAESRPLVFLLYGAAILLLLVACANLASLLVARAATRQAEFSTRAALGASRSRLVSQMMVESLILSVAGGLAGIGLAKALLRMLPAIAPDALPRLDEIQVDISVLAFSLATTIVTGLLFGLGPVAGLSRLMEMSRGRTSSGVRVRLRSALVVGQVAVSLVLLAGAGLFIRSLENLSQVDAGFEVEGVVTMNFVLGANEYPTGARMIEFARQFDERLKSTPGVADAGFSTSLPLSGQGWGNPISVDKGEPLPSNRSNVARIQAVSPRYLQTLKTPLRLGRHLRSSDDGGAPSVVVVDELFARTFLGEKESPIGRRIKVGDAASSRPWLTVVGVVASSRQISLEGDPEPHIFLPYLQIRDIAPMVGRGVYVAGRGVAPDASIAALKSQISEIAPNLALREAQPLSARLGTALAPQRFRTGLLGGFAALAVLIAGVGLYGVISFVVAQQAREIGLRIALGAQASEIASMVLGRGAGLGALGVVIGVAASLGLSRFLEQQRLLFGVGPRDAATLVAVSALLGAVVLAASYLPARRASLVEPMKALRTE